MRLAAASLPGAFHAHLTVSNNFGEAVAILILSSSADPHSKIVSEKIRSAGGEAHILDSDGDSQFEFSLTLDGHARMLLNRRDIGSVDRVWNRGKIRLELVATSEQRDEFLRRSEWSGTYRSIASYFAGCVVNDPVAQTRCEQKSTQQMAAAQLGFLVPPTPITNSRTAALEFAEEHKQLICKSVGRPQLPYNQSLQGPTAMVTCAVEAQDISSYAEEKFAVCATFLQARIDKRYEYRVAVVSGRVFAFRLYSQELPETQTDWRLFCSRVRHEFVNLPSDVEQRLLEFLDAFGLWQGQFDLIEDPQGQMWFVECNPNGQWLWLDPYVDGALSDWYAEALLSGDVPNKKAA